ncbi:MAG: hypothetical protein R2864_10310 [Syntrophotaleaceae bacterium]
MDTIIGLGEMVTVIIISHKETVARLCGKKLWRFKTLDAWQTGFELFLIG